MATATLEQITEQQLNSYRNLAVNSGNVEFIEQHGIPVVENFITYSVAKRISGGNGEELEYAINMWMGSPHQGIVQVPMHLEIGAKEGLVTIALHDEHKNPEPIERIRVEAGLEQPGHILHSFPETLLLGYTIPSAGLPQSIASLVFLDGKKGRILRLLESETLTATQINAALTKAPAQQEKTLHELLEEKAKEYQFYNSDYTFLIKGSYNKIEIVRALGVNFSTVYKMREKHPDYFKGSTLQIKDLVQLVISYVEQVKNPLKPEKKLERLTPFLDSIATYYENVIKSASGDFGDGEGKGIEDAVAVHGDEQAIGRKRQKIHTEPPDIKYETVLKHPEAILPSLEDAAYILGITANALSMGTYRRHPWIKKDGTIGALERYIHFRAEKTPTKKPEIRQSELEATLKRLKEYEGKNSQPHVNSVSPAKIINEPPPDGLIATKILSDAGMAAGAGTEYSLKDIFIYHPGKKSEFASLLNDGKIKPGAFVYHQNINDSQGEVGTLESIVSENGKPVSSIDVRFPNAGLKTLSVNGETLHYKWMGTIFIPNFIPEGTKLPDGTDYSSESHRLANDVKITSTYPHYSFDGGSRLIDYILARRYTDEEVGKLLGYDNRQEREETLKRLKDKRLLAPGEDGKYIGESIIRFAISSGYKNFFLKLGYKGDKEEILKHAGADLEARTKGGGVRRMPSAQIPLDVHYNFSGENGAAYKAWVEQNFPGDKLALGLVAELMKGPLDSNYAGQELPIKLKRKADEVFSALELLMKKDIVTMNEMAEYTLRPLPVSQS